jgi:hypothetical protein
LRSAVCINDHDSFAGKTFQYAGLNRTNDGLDGFGIIVGGDAYQDVDLAHINELAKEIVRQKRLFRQFNLRAKFHSR